MSADRFLPPRRTILATSAVGAESLLNINVGIAAEGGAIRPFHINIPEDIIFTSPTELASALRRAQAAHGEHEKRTGKRDADWPSWYAKYMIREQAGKPLPS